MTSTVTALAPEYTLPPATECCPKPDKTMAPLDPAKYNDYLHKAIAKDACKPPVCETGDVVCKTYKERIVVPCEEEVRVPVEREVMRPGFRKQTIKGHRLVPKQKWKPVEEKHIEVKEEICRGTRTVWKPFEEEYCEVIKKPVEVCKTRYVPYTEYCQEEVDVEVEVPCDQLQLQCGHRMDKKLKSKIVEVEKQEYFKMVPTRIDCPPKYNYKELGEMKDLGVVEVGKDIYGDCPEHYKKHGGKPDYTEHGGTVYGGPAEAPTYTTPPIEEDYSAAPGPEPEMVYKHLDAMSFTSSSHGRPPTRTERRPVSQYSNRPPTGMTMGVPPPMSRGGSFERPSSRGGLASSRGGGQDIRDRPPTGALFMGPGGKVMTQPKAGMDGRMNVALAAMAQPQQARLKTPYTNGAASGRMLTGYRPPSQAGSQRLVLDNGRPGSGSRRAPSMWK